MISKLKLIALTLVSLILLNIPMSCDAKSKDMAVSYYNKGIINYEDKEFPAAIDNFKKATKIDPNFSDAYYNLAIVYSYLGKKEQAISTYAKLLKLNSHDFDATFEIAKLYSEIENYSLSSKYLSEIPPDYKYYTKVKLLQLKNKNKIKERKEKQEKLRVTRVNSNKKETFYQFTSPTGITADTKGNIYTANYSNNYISKITPDKKHYIFAQSDLINSPIGLASDKENNIYVANYETNNILKITSDGETNIFLTNIKKPYFLYIKDNVLYISEQDTNTIIKFDLKN